MKRSTTHTIFICGISGVGKTKLIESVIDRFPSAVTWRASEIIGQARKVTDSETLRKLAPGEIQQSQELLLQGFLARRGALPDALVLLDAHSVIDTESGFIDIPVRVIAGLAPSGIIHVSDDVARISERRLADPSRVRPERSLGQLAEYQQRSIALCERYSAALDLPLVEVRSGDWEAFAETIRDLSTS